MRFAAVVLVVAGVAGPAGAQFPDAAAQAAIQQQILQQQIMQQQVQLSILQSQLAAQQAANTSFDFAQSGPRPNEVIPPAAPDPKVVAIPTFWPKPGTFSGSVTISISDQTPFATIYYTTDGSVPTTQSLRYNGPITITKDQKVMAMAVAPELWPSPVAIGPYQRVAGH